MLKSDPRRSSDKRLKIYTSTSITGNQRKPPTQRRENIYVFTLLKYNPFIMLTWEERNTK